MKAVDQGAQGIICFELSSTLGKLEYGRRLAHPSLDGTRKPCAFWIAAERVQAMQPKFESWSVPLDWNVPWHGNIALVPASWIHTTNNENPKAPSAKGSRFLPPGKEGRKWRSMLKPVPLVAGMASVEPEVLAGVESTRAAATEPCSTKTRWVRHGTRTRLTISSVDPSDATAIIRCKGNSHHVAMA